nr:hypothetical protein [Streptomyces sp. BK340]
MARTSDDAACAEMTARDAPVVTARVKYAHDRFAAGPRPAGAARGRRDAPVGPVRPCAGPPRSVQSGCAGAVRRA